MLFIISIWILYVDISYTLKGMMLVTCGIRYFHNACTASHTTYLKGNANVIKLPINNSSRIQKLFAHIPLVTRIPLEKFYFI